MTGTEAEYIVVSVGDYGLKAATLNEGELLTLIGSERYMGVEERIAIVLSIGSEDELDDGVYAEIQTPVGNFARSIEVGGVTIALDYNFGQVAGQFFERGHIETSTEEKEHPSPFKANYMQVNKYATFSYPGWTSRDREHKGLALNYFAKEGVETTLRVNGDSTGHLIVSDNAYSKVLWDLLSGGVTRKPIEDVRYRDKSAEIDDFTKGIIDAIFKEYK